MSGDAETFDARLRAGRRAAGLTQEELAGRSGLSVRAIRDLESGRTRWPYPNSLHRLADALGLAGPVREEFIVAAEARLGRPGPPGQRACPGPPAAARGGARLRGPPRPAHRPVTGAAAARRHGGHLGRGRHGRGREDRAGCAVGARGGPGLPRRPAVPEPARFRPVRHAGLARLRRPGVPGRAGRTGRPDAAHARRPARPVPELAGRPADADRAGQRAGRGPGPAAAARRTDLPGDHHQPQPAHRPGRHRRGASADAGRDDRRRGHPAAAAPARCPAG